MAAKAPSVIRVIGRSAVDWWDGWLDMVLITLVWTLAQITVVLGPPATFGYYSVVHEMTNGQALGVKGLFSGAKKYFWKAWLWGLVNLLGAAILVANFTFYGGFKTAWAPYVQVIVLLVGTLWYSTVFYSIPYFFEQEIKSLFIAFRNGFLTSLASPLFTFIVMLVVVLVIGLSAGFIIPFFLGLPGLIPFLGLRAVTNRLEAFGLRKAEKTPREIEMEESAKANAPVLRLLAQDDTPVSQNVAESEGDVEQGK